MIAMNQEFLKFRLTSLTQMLVDPEVSIENRRVLETIRAEIEEELRILEKSEPRASDDAKEKDAGSK